MLKHTIEEKVYSSELVSSIHPASIIVVLIFNLIQILLRLVGLLALIDPVAKDVDLGGQVVDARSKLRLTNAALEVANFLGKVPEEMKKDA